MSSLPGAIGIMRRIAVPEHGMLIMSVPMSIRTTVGAVRYVGKRLNLRENQAVRAYLRLNIYLWLSIRQKIKRGEVGFSNHKANDPTSKTKIMKTYKHLWEKLITEENFEIAYRNSIKHKGGQRQVQIFQENVAENLEKVRQLVISGNFHTSKYCAKIIYEPKERVIYKLPYNPDRIVQHAIMNILKPILTNLFIENSFACIEGRGTHAASLKCSEYTRKYKYCLKCDIRKFYPSINQRVLSDMFHRIIRDDRFMEIIDDIIFSFEGGYNCPIGNYCSQWFGNFYLTVLDNYVLHDLKCKGYVRYCDDFLLFDNSKEYLQDCRWKIKQFLWDKLELSFSKDDVFPTKRGVDYCGYRSFGKYVLLRKSTAKRIKRRVKKIDEKINTGDIDICKTQGQLASAHGQLKHCCSHHLADSIGLYEKIDAVKRLSKEVQHG